VGRPCRVLSDYWTEQESRRPLVVLHFQILNKIQMFLLVKILISTTPHRYLQTELQLQCPCTKSYDFPTCQVLKLLLLEVS